MLSVARSSSARILTQAAALALSMAAFAYGAPHLSDPVRHRDVASVEQVNPAAQGRPASASLAIPPGTILPVQLRTTVSSDKSKPGHAIVGRVMQDVPLPNGQKIPRGSRVLGTVVAVSPVTAAGSEITLRFDRLQAHGRTASIRTNLRAIAGFVAVEEAHLPLMSSGEGEVYDWLPTKQVGGDDVYGVGGVVTRWNNPSEVVGKETPDGLLGRLTAREGSSCRGPSDGNDALQALWVFSSDACGVYELPGVTIAHAGRTDPRGLVVLRSSQKRLKLPSGTGMLLRIQKADED